MNPLISLIVPVYQTEAYLCECLDSILAQTLLQQVPTALEVIVLDDASPDRSWEILKQYQNDHPRLFRLYRHENNRGLGATRNHGIHLARGDYLAFLDSDDVLVADACEALLTAAQANQADYVQAKMSLWQGMSCEPLEASSLAENSSVCHKLFSRRFVQSHQLRFAEGELFEDEIFSYLAHHYARHVEPLSQVVYLYRSNPSGICRSRGDQKRLYARMSCLVHFLETVRGRNLLCEMEPLIVEMICRHALLQLKAEVSWTDLSCYWHFSQHLLTRYGLSLESSSSYFCRKFHSLYSGMWRLWLTHQYSLRRK